MITVTQPTEVFTGASPVQATRDAAATQPVEASSTRLESAANMTATRPVEAPGTGRSATQLVETPGVRMDTQPVEAPGARTNVCTQLTSTGSGDIGVVDRSLSSTRTVAAATGVSDTEDELHSEPESPAAVSDREVLSDRDPVRDDKHDQGHS